MTSILFSQSEPLQLIRLDDRVGLGNSVSTSTLEIESAPVRLSEPVGPTEGAPTLTLESHHPNLLVTCFTLVPRLRGRRRPLIHGRSQLHLGRGTDGLYPLLCHNNRRRQCRQGLLEGGFGGGGLLLLEVVVAVALGAEVHHRRRSKKSAAIGTKYRLIGLLEAGTVVHLVLRTHL